MSTIPMYLDFYNNSIKTINSKQYDTSRNIKITCTDMGKKVYLDHNHTSAIIRYKKNDGNNVFKDADILEDGTVLMKIVPQMVTTIGRHRFDVIIFNQFGLKVDTLLNVDSFDDLGVDILSTMIAYINVVPATVNHKEVESTSEYNALMLGLANRAVTETRLIELEELLTTNEENRKIAESERQETIKRAEIVADKLDEINESIDNCNNVINEANDIIQETNNVINNANESIDRANKAAEICETITDFTGVVLKESMGVPNGVATLNESGYIPENQLNLSSILSQISSIQDSINNMHKIHFGYDEPDSSIGSNGDIYLKIIDESNENE